MLQRVWNWFTGRKPQPIAVKAPENDELCDRPLLGFEDEQTVRETMLGNIWANALLVQRLTRGDVVWWRN